MAEKIIRGAGKTVKSLEFYFAMLLLFFELVFHFIRFGGTWENIIYKMMFAVFYGLLLGILAGILPRKVSKIVTMVLTAVFSLYFIVQIIYSGVFNTYLSLAGSVEVTGQAFDFTDVIWKEIRQEWWMILLMLLPVVFICTVGRNLLCYERHLPWVYIINVMALAAVFIYTLLIMSVNNKDMYSAYNVFRNYSSVDMSIEKLGVTETLWLDAIAGIRNTSGKGSSNTDFVIETAVKDDGSLHGTEEEENQKKEDSEAFSEGNTEPAENTEEPEPDLSPNVLDIDLDSLIADESNENIKKLHQYIKTAEPTNKNEYTGMFSGYNLIFVVAEGFSGYSVDAQRTPTLYRLSHEGFHFRNYYTPLWYGSTLGGEYADLTGLMPKNGGYLSMKKSGKNGNDMMFTLSEQLNRQGYTVTGYHNNDYKYYGRNVSHTNLGYNWIGVGNGYEAETNSYGNALWPQSDLRMIQNTFDDYAGKEPFHTYYLTVSGHVLYDFGSNSMAARHKDIVENLSYSDTTKAYLACQYELELAMAELVQKLEDAGIADRTLIVLTADHVPYDNKDVLDELAGRELGNTFEWYQNTLIIWSASMEHPVQVDKYCSSLDILPTVSNLMGLSYDSRMLVGQDILSDSEGLVIFNDRSFITDRCSYNAGTGEVISLDGTEIPEDYIANRKAAVKNKFSMAEGICDYDYYKYIDNAVYKDGNE